MKGAFWEENQAMFQELARESFATFVSQIVLLAEASANKVPTIPAS
jgi:hypothetical protein